MSTEYPTSPWRRDDWYGTPESDTDAGIDPDTDTATTRTRRQRKAAHLAHQLLRGVAPALCAVSCADPKRSPVELGDAEHYPHGEGAQTHTQAVRANPEDGYLSGGESTAVVRDGTPTAEFLALVETWLDHCVAQGVIGTDLRGTLYADAQSMKQGTDLADDAILTRLVTDALAGERLSTR